MSYYGNIAYRSGRGVGYSAEAQYHSVHTFTATSTDLPVSVSEVRAHLGYGTEVDAALDAELEGFIRAAAVAVEAYCQDLKLLTSTVRADLPVLDFETMLRMRPFVEFTSVEYVKADDGEITTIAADQYHVISGRQFRASLYLGEGNVWPEAATRADAFRLTYNIGWTPATLPHNLKNALLQIVAKLNASRGDCEDSSASASVYAMKNTNATAFPPAAVALLEEFKLHEVWAA